MGVLTRLLAAFALGLALLTAPAAALQLPEYEVKMGFLYNFAKFVRWPGEPSGPFVIGILGDDPFGRDLDRAVAKRTVRGRPFEVVRYATIEEIETPGLLFVSASHSGDVARLLEHLGTRPVLTIGDDETLLDRGIMIAFAIEGRKIRFDVNTIALSRTELEPSAALLEVARRVLRSKDLVERSP